MIVTVLVSGSDEQARSHAELVEFLWQQSNQPGELLQLAAAGEETVAPVHTSLRSEAVRSWTLHPYIEDIYEGYNLPAAVMEWLLEDPIEATVLLLDEHCLPGQDSCEEAGPRKAVAQQWDEFPSGDGPFGLSELYQPLQAYCVNRELTLAPIRLPLLIHTSDLRRIAPRWLELLGLIRHHSRSISGAAEHVLPVTLAIAAAEYGINLTAADLTSRVQHVEYGSPGYQQHMDLLAQARESGEDLKRLRPLRRHDVKQGRVLDNWYLSLASPPDFISLNQSAGVIWAMCDGKRSLFDIASQLQEKYGVPLPTLLADVAQTAKMLRARGALEMEVIPK